MAVSSKYTLDLSVQIVFFTFSCKWFLCFYLWAVIQSYIVDLFAALHELATASATTLLKLAQSVRAWRHLKPISTCAFLGLFSKQLHCTNVVHPALKSPALFRILHYGLYHSLPGSTSIQNPRWQLVSCMFEFQQNNSAFQIFTQCTYLPKAGKYSKIICRSTQLSQAILLLQSFKISTFS